jgi:CRISPR-associated protein Csd1
MLLKHLYDLAQSPSRKILDDEAFEVRAIRWIVDLDVQGNFVGVQETGDGKRGKEYPSVPKTARVKKGKVAEFLADGIDSIFGLSPDPAKPKDARMLRGKFDDFWQQIADAATATTHPMLQALFRFKPESGQIPTFLRLDGNKWQIRPASGAETKFTGILTFRVGNELLIEDEQIRAYWRNAFADTLAKQETEAEIGLCLVTGDNNVPLARTHTPRIRNIPGVGIDGTIVSFEKSAPAFSSYGKKQSYNAPCSITATRAYSRALQFLVDDSDHHVRIGETKLCFWTREQEQATGLFARLLNTPDAQSVAQFLQQPFRGVSRELAHRDQFYAATVGGCTGRIVVRHWVQVPLDTAIENLRRWFAELELIVLPRETNPKFSPLAIRQLAQTTAPLTVKAKRLVPDEDKLPADLLGQLYRAALEATAPSLALLKPILDQLHSRLVRDENYNLLFDESRFALLKLILNRNRKDTDMEIKPQLTADTDDPAYNSGRLLAVFDDLQQRAHEWKLEGATVAERYYGSASATPATAFGILWRLHLHHLKKLRGLGGKQEAAANAIERKITGICALLGQTSEMKQRRLAPSLPRTLDLQAQGRFALGYYQQKAEDKAGQQAAANNKNQTETK